jgi:hypothetical protein
MWSCVTSILELHHPSLVSISLLSTKLSQVEGKELKKHGSVAICPEDKWFCVLLPLNYANPVCNPITVFR